MKKKIIFAFISVCICANLTACGQSQKKLNEVSTQVAASVFTTQTAQAPTDTSTPVPTETATAVPTVTTIPTLTPNLIATGWAETQETNKAIQNTKQTATAIVSRATEQAIDDMWVKLVSDGSITYSMGEKYPVDDFEESWAQRNWYQWWLVGGGLSDFVILTHIEWEIPEGGSFGIGGCGFAFRIKDESNHLVIFIEPKGSVALGAMSPSGFQYQDFHWQNPALPNFFAVAPPTTGNADFLVVVEKEFVSAYINGERVYQWYVALTDSGDVGYTIVSGTNKDFGINCKFTDTLVWELVK
jgi:hypothetical protein